MGNYSRRQFLQAAGLLGAGSLLGSSIAPSKSTLPLSFSTLGCPDWTLDQIMAFASANGYKGIELRGIQRELDLTKRKEFSSPAAIKTTMQAMAASQLRFVDLGSSATLHFPAGAERVQNIDDGKRFIDLAEQLACPYIRVFPNNFIQEQTKEKTMEFIAAGLLELANHARGSNVMVLLETHGDLVHTEDLVKLMQMANDQKVGLIWDISNMWTVTKEPVRLVHEQLKNFIRHTHLKDAKLVEGKPQYTLLGQGEVPWLEAVGLLRQNNYKGYYSFEWEKLWHPEIAEPEIALADFPKVIKRYFN